MKISLTDTEISEINDKLSFHKDPVFEKSDIDTVLFAFRTFGEDAFEWLHVRRHLFNSSKIIPYLKRLLHAVQEKR